MKILIGQFMQEGDSFSPKKSELIPAHCTYCAGEDIPKRYRGTHTQLGAYIEAAEREGADILYTQSAAFVSSGCVSRKAFETVRRGIVDGVCSFHPDIIFLSLHGACILEDYHDAEGLLLKDVRAAAGEDCVIVSPFDMHAYMSFDIVSSLNALSGYKTYPHVDQYDRAMDAAQLALRVYKEKLRICIAMTRVPLIVAAERGQTDEYPIGPIVEYAKRLEAEGKILNCALSIVQPWMDIDHVGSTATVCAETPEAAVKYSRELAERIWAIRGDSQINSTPIAEAVSQARAKRGCGKPVLFVDSADSPGAGATCDSSYVAKALIELGGDLRSIGSVVDKDAAQLAASLPEGAPFECELGFHETPVFGKPFHFKGEVWRHCPAVVDNVKKAINGRVYDLGLRSILRCGNVYVMVMEHAGCGQDPALYTSCGLDIADFDIVCGRSALQYRTHYEGLYETDILVDSPGASCSDIASMPFAHTVWPVYPIDKNAAFTPHTMLSVR